MVIWGVVNQRFPPPYQTKEGKNSSKNDAEIKEEEIGKRGRLPVEEGGLADVGAADDDDCGEEGGVDFGKVDS